MFLQRFYKPLQLCGAVETVFRQPAFPHFLLKLIRRDEELPCPIPSIPARLRLRHIPQ